MDAPEACHFFLVPPELRLLIYEFVFTTPPLPLSNQAPLPKSSHLLRPLLTCRKIYAEARYIAFASTIHILNWTRSSSCLRQIRVLDPVKHLYIRHVALFTSTAGLYERLLPFRFHTDHSPSHHPHLALDSLTIVLEYPDPHACTHASRQQRIKELDMIFSTIWYLKNITKVVLFNVAYREGLKECPATNGRWTCIDDGTAYVPSGHALSESCFSDHVRWCFELTNFYDYAWKPWHVQR
jgi:hypothetical protein